MVPTLTFNLFIVGIDVSKKTHSYFYLILVAIYVSWSDKRCVFWFGLDRENRCYRYVIDSSVCASTYLHLPCTYHALICTYPYLQCTYHAPICTLHLPCTYLHLSSTYHTPICTYHALIMPPSAHIIHLPRTYPSAPTIHLSAHSMHLSCITRLN